MMIVGNRSKRSYRSKRMILVQNAVSFHTRQPRVVAGDLENGQPESRVHKDDSTSIGVADKEH
jgi:hypothetical protein